MPVFMMAFRIIIGFVVVGVIAVVLYKVLNKSKRIQEMVDPEGPSVLEQARDTANKVRSQKEVNKAAQAQLQQENEELEQFFPGNKKRNRKKSAK